VRCRFIGLGALVLMGIAGLYQRLLFPHIAKRRRRRVRTRAVKN